MEYVIVLCAVAALLIFIDNRRIKASRYKIKSGRLPRAFLGFKILQISDLHGAVFGKKNRRLLKKIAAEKPDIIVITGDIVYSRNPRVERAAVFVCEAVKIAPTYFSSGNHESDIESYEPLKNALERAGASVLENQTESIEKDGEKIALSGLTDPHFVTDYSFENSLSAVKDALAKMDFDNEKFNVLLAHRPELMAAYRERGIDLVFSGHAHGGQFRLPFLGGLFVPIQGVFPKYDAGLIQEGKTRMLISRGLGRSVVPVRLCNCPEIVVAELTKSAE